MRILRRFGFAVLCLALFIGAIYAVEDWRGARAWSATVREVSEHGGTTDFAAVIPAPVPDDQNLAMAPLFVNALDYQLDPETKQLTFGTRTNDPRLAGIHFGQTASGKSHPAVSEWQRGRPTDLSGWQTYFRSDPKYPQAPDPQSPADGVLMALSRYKAPLDDLAKAAAERPLSRFPINWTSSEFFKMPLPQVVLLMDLASALSLRASAEVASGRQADAAADIALGFRLSEALNEDPILIDDLVSTVIIARMTQPIWDGLAAGSWNADQLKRLQTLLSRQDALASYARAMRTEEASAPRAIDCLEQRGDTGGVLQILEIEGAHLPLWARLCYRFAGIAPKGWYDQNKSHVAQREEKYALAAVDPARRRVFPSIIAAGVAEAASKRASPYTLYSHTSWLVAPEPLARAARAQVSCDQAAIACALERCLLDHDNYPGNLAALTPDYLAKTPTDIIDGAPMRYERTADGRYRLSSIGWIDRGHDVQVAWKHGPREDDPAGKWVWQYHPEDRPEFRQN